MRAAIKVSLTDYAQSITALAYWFKCGANGKSCHFYVLAAENRLPASQRTKSLSATVLQQEREYLRATVDQTLCVRP